MNDITISSIQLDRRRQALRVVQFLIIITMLGALLAGPMIYPFGFIIFISCFLILIFLLRPVKRAWRRDVKRQAIKNINGGAVAPLLILY